MPETKPKLKQLLSDLLAKCKAEPGSPQILNLRHGLRIALRVHVGGEKLSLGISRLEIEPSDQEWGIVCRDLGLPQTKHKVLSTGKRKWFTAVFDLQPELIP